jgi:tetratricopeptide (TPR) repeat protein
LAHHPDSSFIDTGKIDEATRTFAEYLHSAASPGFRSMLEYFEAEDHSSVSLLSLYHGLLFIFEGYKPSSEDFLEQPAAVRAHFERISDRLGVVLLPPEVLVIQLGYTLLYETKDVDGAIELFKLNVSNYPESCHVWDSLGEAYLVKGDKPKAIEHYEKSLELKPDNEIAKQQLETLRSEQESQ